MANPSIMHNVTVNVRNVKAVAQRVKKVPKKVGVLERIFWARKAKSYKIFAKWLVLNVVYGAYSPRVYQRTYKLRNSVKSQRLANGLLLYQDPQMTPEATSAKAHRWPSYAFYFIYGGGFLAMVNAKPRRDFLAAWYRYFRYKFPRDYRAEVIRPALRG